jgi:hypothetical protein
MKNYMQHVVDDILSRGHSKLNQSFKENENNSIAWKAGRAG